MSKEENNKAIVGRWFTDFWGKTSNLGIVDELAAPDMLLQYSLHAPRKGHADIKAFMSDFRNAFPDLNFWFVRKTRGLIPALVICQVSDRARVRDSGRCGIRRIFSW